MLILVYMTCAINSVCAIVNVSGPVRFEAPVGPEQLVVVEVAPVAPDPPAMVDLGAPDEGLLPLEARRVLVSGQGPVELPSNGSSYAGSPGASDVPPGLRSSRSPALGWRLRPTRCPTISFAGLAGPQAPLGRHGREWSPR